MVAGVGGPGPGGSPEPGSDASPGQPEWPSQEWPKPWPGPGWPSAPANVPEWGNAAPPVRPGPPAAPPGAEGPKGLGQARGGEAIGLGPNTRCYVHPDRLAGAICRSCDRPICADCMVQAPVGWHCHDCVRRNAKKSPVIRYQPRTGGLPTLAQVPVTMGLIGVCVALFVASSANPNLLNETAMGGAAVEAGQWYRLFTNVFFHVNIVHIGLNMVSLMIIGRLVEPVLGKWRYLALFLVAGFGGSVACYLLSNPFQGAVGASGAIFGLFGAYFVLARRARADSSGILVLIAINLFYSFVVPGISWQGHVGGLVTGVVLAAGFGLGRGRRQELATDILAVACVCAALGLLLFLPPGVVNLG